MVKEVWLLLKEDSDGCTFSSREVLGVFASEEGALEASLNLVEEDTTQTIFCECWELQP